MNKRNYRNTSAGRKKQAILSLPLVGLCLLSAAFSAQAAYITFHDEVTYDYTPGIG